MKKYGFYIIMATVLFACSSKDNNALKTNTTTEKPQEKQNQKYNYNEKWTTFFTDPRQGNPYITNFELNRNINSTNYTIIQDDDLVMLFANRHGIVSFDGSEWRIIDTPNMPFTIVKDETTGKIYVGCASGFGRLDKNEKGAYFYKSLSDSLNGLGATLQICINQTSLFFQGQQFVVRLNKDLSKGKLWRAGYASTFNGLFKLNDDVYVNLSENGIHQLKETDGSDISVNKTNLYKIKKMGFADNQFINIRKDTVNFSVNHILFYVMLNKNQVLLGSSDNRLYSFDGKSLAPFQFEGRGFIFDNILTSGVDLSSEEFALGTLSGGVIVVDKITRKTIFNINYQTGLPDDEVMMIGSDQNQGLWINHSLGVSRVNFSLPIKNYSTYPGLSGNLSTLSQFDNSIYVGTTDGVFYLSEIKDIKEINTYVKMPMLVQEELLEQTAKPVKIKTVEKKVPVPQNTNAQTQQVPSQKKGWLSKLFNKKANKAQPSNQTATQQTTENQQTQEESQTNPEEIVSNFKTTVKHKVVSKKQYALQSIRNVFRKVEGISDKCKQLIPLNDRILVATNTGIYEIKNKKATSIIKGKQINQIVASKDKNRFFVASNTGITSIYYYPLVSKWIVDDNFSDFTENVNSIIQTQNNKLWLGGESAVYQVEIDANAFPLNIKPYPVKTKYQEPVYIREINGEPMFFSSEGNYKYDAKKDAIITNDTLINKENKNFRFLFQQSNITWVNKSGDWTGFNISKEMNILGQTNLKLFDNLVDIFVDHQENLWVINGNQLVEILNLGKNNPSNYSYDVYIKSLLDDAGQAFDLSEINLEYNNSSVSFKISAPFYIKTKSNMYQYYIEGMMNKWSNWNTNTAIDLVVIPPGSYKLNVRAKNVFGKISNTKTINFVVDAPIYMKVWFWILIILILIGIGFYIAKYREKSLIKKNEILEQKVEERTAEVVKQKKEITDSIRYASRIQRALLPQPEMLQNMPFQYFILYKPRDIVSGDYYYFAHQDNKYIIAAGDCTGHGVPGAFMSMLGISFLNQIIKQQNVSSSENILNTLRDYVINSLHQTGKKDESRDGMDIALMILDLDNMKVQYSGANNSMYLIRQGLLNEFKPNKMPIGYYPNLSPFKSIEVDIQKGDMIYLFSDGYVDQFGGGSSKKFLTKKFKMLLTTIYNKPIEQQELELEKAHQEWKGIEDQVDDILVIGLKI